MIRHSLVIGIQRIYYCQFDTGATCNVIGYNDLVQLLQNGDPPLSKIKAQVKLFDDTLMQPPDETILTVKRKGQRLDLRFQVFTAALTSPHCQLKRMSSRDFSRW